MSWTSSIGASLSSALCPPMPLFLDMKDGDVRDLADLMGFHSPFEYKELDIIEDIGTEHPV